MVSFERPVARCSCFVHIGNMGMPDNRLVFMAITALDEVVEHSRIKAVDPSPSLRFVLAWLYTHSGTYDRSAYDDFYRTVTDPMDRAYSNAAANSMRGGQASTHLQRIARLSGIHINADVQCELRQARMTKAERIEYRNSPCYRFAHRLDKG